MEQSEKSIQEAKQEFVFTHKFDGSEEGSQDGSCPSAVPLHSRHVGLGNRRAWVEREMDKEM